MKYISLFFSLCAATFLASCANDAAEDTQSNNDDAVQTVRFVVEDFVWDSPSDAPASHNLSSRYRTQAQKNSSGVSFIWSATDTVGIYSTRGSQMEFPIATGDGEAYAEFDGGCWAMKNECTYMAYYPFNKYNLDRSNIPFVYGTAKQVGNDNVDNLTQYDYIVSQHVRPTDGKVTFQFRHLGALVKFVLTVPEADSFSSFTLVATDAVFPTRLRLDLSSIMPKYTVETKSRTFSMRLSDISVEAGGTVTLWALMPYADLSGNDLTAILYGNGGKMYTTTLTGKKMESGKAYQYMATLEAQTNYHEWVDLGLPSGKKWATCNVGAASPEKYGNFYAWGETEPDASGEYSWATYKYSNGTYATLKKYNNNKSYGTVDNKTVLDPEDDAATVNWSYPWRTPTYEEFDELRTQCTWTWKTKNGAYGFQVTGPNGNSIFSPAAGYRNIGSLNFAGSYGYYWSSSLDENNPSQTHVLYFHGTYFGWGTYTRSNGRNVRPVCD